MSECKFFCCNRLTVKLAMAMAGSFGWVSAVVLPALQPAPRAAVVATTEEKPTAAAKEVAGAPTPELERFCKEHVSESRSFVVFRNGTCVMVDEPCPNPEGQACKILAECAGPDLAFVPERTRDGNLIVAFKQPVFSLFAPRELHDPSPWLNRLVPVGSRSDRGEVAMADPADTSVREAVRIARQRLLEDVAHAVPVKIIRLPQRETVAR